MTLNTNFRWLPALFVIVSACAADSAVEKTQSALVAPSLATPTYYAGTLRAGQPRDVTFQRVRVQRRAVASRSIAMRIELGAGDTAHLTASGIRADGSSATIDTELFVFRTNRDGRATGRALAYNDDFDGRVDSYLAFVADQAGTYVVIAQRYDRKSTGRIRVGLDVEAAQRACGSRGLLPCRPDEFCSWEPSAQCGATDRPGVCVRRPDACIALYTPVCGCDGRTYSNSCAAASAGVSVATDGECPDVCRVMDARGEGQCRRLPFGFAWDGSRCSVGQGCTCVGADCERLYGDEDACRAAHTSCFSACLATAAWGEGECDQVLGYKWDGNACVAVSGCSCSGRACAALLPSEAECQREFGYCAPDCRTTGCEAGSRCDVCWAGFACLPEGAVC